MRPYIKMIVSCFVMSVLTLAAACGSSQSAPPGASSAQPSATSSAKPAAGACEAAGGRCVPMTAMVACKKELPNLCETGWSCCVM